MSEKLFDAAAMFWKDTDLSATPWDSTGTINSSSIDLGGDDVDEYVAPEIVLKAPAAGSAGAPTVTLTLQDSADNVTFAAVTPAVVVTGALTLAEFKAGLRAQIPKKGVRRYVRLQAIVAVAGFNAGVLNAGLVK